MGFAVSSYGVFEKSKEHMKSIETLSEVTNDAASQLSMEEPYIVSVTVEGQCPLIFHRWSCDDIENKAKAAKGSRAKKTDNVESYVWRNAANEICIPGEYFRMSMVNAAKFAQDPRSPRKSAMDLFKAGIVVLNELCSLGATDWDYLDRRRAVVQRQGLTRIRPAFHTGWEASFTVQVILPEYISRQFLNEILQKAGRLVGVADQRPTYGRFAVTHFE